LSAVETMSFILGSICRDTDKAVIRTLTLSADSNV